MKFDLGLVFLNKRFLLLGFRVCFKMRFDLGLMFPDLGPWLLGLVSLKMKFSFGFWTLLVGFFVLIVSLSFLLENLYKNGRKESKN